MKALITLITLFISTVLFAKETRKVSTFSSISIGTSIQASYIHSDRNEVVLTAEDANHLKHITTVVKNGTLDIRIDNKGFRNIRQVKAIIYGPNKLNNIIVSSSAQLSITPLVESSNTNIKVNSSGMLTANVKANALSIDVSSSGNFKGSISVEELTCKVSSSGRAVVDGTANQTIIQTSSSGKADLTNVKTTDATVSASSSGQAMIAVDESITAKASSSGKITYSGSPKNKQVSTSSSGKIVSK